MLGNLHLLVCFPFEVEGKVSTKAEAGTRGVFKESCCGNFQGTWLSMKTAKLRLGTTRAHQF